MASITLGELAELVGGRLEGPPEFTVHGIRPLEEAGPFDLSFAVGRRYLEKVRASRAGALILPEDWPEPPGRPALFVRDPYLAYALSAGRIFESRRPPSGVSEKAAVAEGAEIHEEAAVLDFAYVGPGVKIGPRAVIHPFVYLGEGVKIGADSVLHPGCVLYPGVEVGERVTIHAGTVVGSDGFGYARGPRGWVKIPQVGRVIIEDDCEIGALCAVDRAALGTTRIRRGVKIDNLVQLAHNTEIGEDTVIVAQVGIAGSTKVGRDVMIGGQAGLVGHIEIGDRARIGAQAGVAQSVAEGETVSGTPAMPHRLWLKASGLLRRLPEMARELRELRTRLERLERQARTEEDSHG